MTASNSILNYGNKFSRSCDCQKYKTYGMMAKWLMIVTDYSLGVISVRQYEVYYKK